MNIGQLANPQAAAEAIKGFQKRFSAKTCMAPMKDCRGPVISAHTLSAEAMLRPISKGGHVYAIETNIYAGDLQKVAKLALRGIRETSVFNGFCEKHDRELFAPIETVPFTCTSEQCFLHAYRAMAKECYLKRKQAENLPSLEAIKTIHGLPPEQDLGYSEATIMHQAASLRGAEEIERAKAKMDEIYLAKEWRRICTTVIPFSAKPALGCNFVYSPDFDFTGNYLQDFGNITVDLSHLMVTVLSSSSGGFALLSHLDTANSAPRRVIESLLAQQDLTSALVWLVACQTENFALSPDWYDSIGKAQQAEFMTAFHSNVNPFNARVDQLKGFKLSIGTWLPQAPFSI